MPGELDGLENSHSWSHKDWEPQVVLVQLGLEGTWALGSFLVCCWTSHYIGKMYPLCWGFYSMTLNATSTETPTFSLLLVIFRGCDSTPRATYLLIRESTSLLSKGLIHGSEHSLSRTIGINQDFCTKMVFFFLICGFGVTMVQSLRIAVTMWLRWEENLLSKEANT